MRKFNSVLLVLIIFFAGCKKYPDGPVLSIHTKMHRLTGEWTPEYFSVNGYDSTVSLKNDPNYAKYFFSKTEDTHGRKYFKSSCGGWWNFTNYKKSLQISGEYAHCDTLSVLGAYGRVNITWQIQKLEEDELWLKTNLAGNEYFVKFRH